MSSFRLTVGSLLLLLCASGAHADPRALPTAIWPTSDEAGPAFQTGIRTIDELAREYVEEEYLVAGQVDVFRYNDPPVRGELVLRDDVDNEYVTRILVRRPASRQHRVPVTVVEWMNSTAGFDSAPAWDMSAEYFGRRGITWVGVTVSPTAAGFLSNGCVFLLSDPCGERYAEVSLTEPGVAYEMVSQIVSLLRSRDPKNPLYPDWVPTKLFHAGQSQQASDLTTYLNEFHFEGNDGYFVQAAATVGKVLSTGSPLFADERGLPRTDLDVPVVRAQTETDIALFGWIARDQRQHEVEAEHFRYYELAGVGHNVVHKVTLFEAESGPVSLGDLCRLPANTGADGPVYGSYLYNAIWRNMERAARRGIPMPKGDPFVVEDGQLARDELGNVLGGIRLPAMQVPLASYGPVNQAKPSCAAPNAPEPPDCLPADIPPIIGLACVLSASAEPLDDETLESLYPSRFDYRLRVLFSSLELSYDRFLLRADRRELLERAWEVEIGRPPTLWDWLLWLFGFGAPTPH